MRCLFCDGKTKVTNTRKVANGKHYRVRTCVKCGERFKTYEINEYELFNVLDEFLPEKVVDEISKRLSGVFRGKDAEI